MRHYTGANGALTQTISVHDSADIQLDDVTNKLPLKVHRAELSNELYMH